MGIMPRRQPPAAFTLIEIILALVILGGAVAVLGEVIQRAAKNAADSRAETQAQILAESVMDEILAGSIDASQASRQPLEVDDAVRWLYSVAIGDTEYEGVIPIEVIVEQDLEARLEPVKYRLMRWIPSVEETDEGAEEAANSQSSSASGGQGGASGSKGGSP
jgi:general secretion pathway protein I